MKAHTIAEWLAEPEERRLELVDGEFIEKAAPDIMHGLAQTRLITAVSFCSIDRRATAARPVAGGSPARSMCGWDEMGFALMYVAGDVLASLPFHRHVR